MYQQREPVAPSFEIRGIWDPEVLLEEDRKLRLKPTLRDRYVVIDEIIGDVVRLAVAYWPEVDAGGRLRFGTEGSEDHAYDRQMLQGHLDQRRESEHQLQRPLRIGDVFFVRDFDADLGIWGRVVDFTMAGRTAAKRAGLRAVAQAVSSPTDEATRDLSWRRPPESAGESPAQEVARPQQPGSIANAVI